MRGCKGRENHDFLAKLSGKIFKIMRMAIPDLNVSENVP